MRRDSLSLHVLTHTTVDSAYKNTGCNNTLAIKTEVFFGGGGTGATLLVCKFLRYKEHSGTLEQFAVVNYYA